MYGPKSRITSLKPLNPINAPNEWEKKALLSFENGESEFLEFREQNGTTHLRFMGPFVTRKPCLKCHGHQGYKEGDIRGGVGISIDMRPYFQIRDQHNRNHTVTHFLIWAIGVVGIFYSKRKGTNYIQERYQTKQKLKETELKYQDLYENAPDMFVSVKASTGKIVRCNKTLLTNLGYSENEVLGKNIFYVYHPDCHSEVEKASHSFVETGVVKDAELQLKRKDGSKIDVSLNVSSTRDEKGEILYSRSIWRDITERKKAEKELQNAYKQLLEAQKLAAIGELSAGVSHEVLNPVNTISVHNQMLKRRNKENIDIQNFSSKVDIEIKHIEKIVHGLLDFSRKEKRRFEKGNLRKEVEKVIDLVEEEYRLDNIEIVRKWCGDFIYIEYDPDKMRQVFLNLIQNAKYAMPKGGTLTFSCKTI